jgi:clan AA aspartic protease
MITGVVAAHEARIRIQVKGRSGRKQDVDAVIDTGYTASLTLPSFLVESLNLQWQSLDRGTLADGSECLFDVYEAEVVWDGQVRRLLVDEADTDPLVGMALLSGYELKMEVCSQGKVEITPLLR